MRVAALVFADDIAGAADGLQGFQLSDLGEGRKVFLFEKRKQKTFANCVQRATCNR
jgi:hypothetical protein